MGFQPRQPGSISPTVVGEVQSAFGYLRRQKWTNPVALDVDRILDGQATSDSAITTVTSFLAQPDFARKITVLPLGTTASVPAGDVTITGTNIRNEVISEAVTFAANATTEQVTTKAFKTITSIVFPIQDGAGATYDVGVNDALGLDRCMSANEVLRATMDGVIEGTLPTVTFNATDVSKNTVDSSTALNAALDLAVVYIATEKTGKRNTTA
jgi:hypothetical protein